MSLESVPHRAQNCSEVNEVVAALKNGKSKTKDKLSCKRTTFKVAETDLSVESWKIAEWDYKKQDLPTYARGLFTYRDPRSGNYEIAIRGYDKFFNINEVHRTKWSWIEENTKGPYEVTMKENGCIIFISGLPDDTLLVCSKHSTGVRKDVPLSHAIAGERWVDKQLQKLHRTRKDLAKALRAANATAVAELCDDSFEEHILDYEGDQAGLYLHGINFNLPKFATYPMDSVQKFADDWGFRRTKFFLKENVTSLRVFLEEAAETGSWDGKDVEGFVIRCKARDGPNASQWEDWFFKYKFDEPYLMYRQWRECTKAMIAGKMPRMRKHEQITKEYLQFASSYFTRNRYAAEMYQKNHGIIKLRNAFLEHRGLKGSDITKQEAASEAEIGNLVLVPVATIGCGKTTLAVALVKLFHWGHFQNDNLTTKKNKGLAFASECAMGLNLHPVVFADRNNHQKRERQQIMEDIGKYVPNARFIALHYIHHVSDSSTLRRVTRSRVLGRGDNHQTIQASSRSKAEVEGIMEGFMRRFEPVCIENNPDNAFDLVIDLDPVKDTRLNLEKVVIELRQAYPKLIPELPAPEEYDAAIKAAISDYQPDLKHTETSGRSKKSKVASASKSVEYFSISLLAEDIHTILDKAFASCGPEDSQFFHYLRENGRIQKTFHVTLIHRASSISHLSMWKKYQDIYSSTENGALGTADVKLDRVVWDDRVMAIAVSILTEGVESVNKIAHIIIGMARDNIKLKEVNEMLCGKGTNELELKGTSLAVRGEIRALTSGQA